ncbi:HEAT repeat protein [Paucimonas lemoignei]|uniref:HEAT repeat protein n=1 Tax=Paucimonas lemoignei TaxID=29443 RepID=A0A4R3HUF1_PAULE|nr:HEAT repeat domain-containing protein [Paucimonas lemoignei]TCS36334.1 HEAT repeat protein [Paucimonas lemoignei]
MKPVMVALCGMGLCAAVAIGMQLVSDEPADDAATAKEPVAPALSQHSAPAGQPAGLWSWGAIGNSVISEPVEALLAQALKPANKPAEGNDPRAMLRQLAKDDPAVMKQLMENYDKQSDLQARDLIVSLLSGVEKPEVLAFSKRLALSKDMAERRDGLTILQRLGGDVPDAHPVILQSLADEKSPELIKVALAALKPPVEADGNQAQLKQSKDAAAIVAQLQSLTRNADPTIRIQSILQLAQWDQTDGSQEQWAQALQDPAPQVRQAAVTAVAQSGTLAGTVKAALLGLANNPQESWDVRGNALLVLERFPLRQDEAANYAQLRSQILGS